jgi:phosphoglycolate phosphatase
MITHLLWDWNGTLLDDLDISVRVLNTMLTHHGLRPIGRERYREVFCFPIYEYYRRVGFDFHQTPYGQLADEYWALYDPLSRTAPLMDGAREVLETLSKEGFVQMILSASEREHLQSVVAHFGIDGYFCQTLGLDNIHAVSKVELGRLWMEESGVPPNQVLFIGDTAHDQETAQRMGVSCVLIPRGHYSLDRLTPLGCPILPHIRALPAYLAQQGFLPSQACSNPLIEGSL